jgi:hypothetical protein
MRHFISYLKNGKRFTKVIQASDDADLLLKMEESGIPTNISKKDGDGYDLIRHCDCPDWASEQFENMSKQWYSKQTIYD